MAEGKKIVAKKNTKKQIENIDTPPNDEERKSFRLWETVENFDYVPEDFFKDHELPQDEWFKFNLKPMSDADREVLFSLSDSIDYTYQTTEAMERAGITRDDVYGDFDWKNCTDEEVLSKNRRPSVLRKITKYFIRNPQAERVYYEEQKKILMSCCNGISSIKNPDEKVKIESIIDSMNLDLKFLVWSKIKAASNLTESENLALK